MNEQEYMKITGGIDERFVAEYENYSARRVTSLRKRIGIGIAVAAAVALMIPAGVFAFTQLAHRDKVSIYYGEEGVRLIEESMLADGYTVDNGKIRLTLDVQMCDGNFAHGVYTLTALTEDAKEHIKQSNTRLVYADNGEPVDRLGFGLGSEGSVGDAMGEDEWTITFTCPLFDTRIDRSRPIKVEFYEYVETGVINKDFSREIVEDDTYYKGLYFNLLTEANVPVKKLRSANGTEIMLAPYGVSRVDKNMKDSEINLMFATLKSFKVITADKERIVLFDYSHPNGQGMDPNDSFVYSGSSGEGYYTIEFGTYIKLDNIVGVEINGVKYMAE